MTHQRTEQEIIDEDLGVLIYRSPASPNWYLQYQDPVKGQQRRSLKVKSLKRARTLAKQHAAKLWAGERDPGPAKMPRIDDLAQRHLAYLELQGKNPRTIELYRRTYQQFARFAAERRIHHLPRVSADLLEDFQRNLADPGVPLIGAQGQAARAVKPAQPKTIYDKLKHLRGLINWAVRRRELREDPAAGYRLPQRPASRGVCFTPEEVRRLCDAAEPPLDDILPFLAMTGLRISELCWLTHRDVCLARGVVLIRDKAIPETGESWSVLKQGDKRAVPLCGEARTIVERAIERSEGKGPWLFADPAGRRWTDSRLAHAMKKTKAAAGVQRGRFHGFRHAYCSWLANRGVSPFQVMKLMGHSSLDIVLTYYNVTEEELVRSVTSAGLEALIATDPVDTAGGAEDHPARPDDHADQQRGALNNQSSGKPVAAGAAAST